ncbi:MAG TPA: FAD-dependent oxidoreductase, partial [Archangium sp.]
MRRIDVAIIGGGPAGLATAIGAASRGLSVEVFERRPGPVDKACGEGLMPAGLAALERLGVRALLREEDTAPFESILYVQQGARVEGRLPSPGGLGVRRLALVDALTKRARAV